jgi:hypothetical protein
MDIAPAACEEAPVFPATKWYADAIYGHYVLSSLHEGAAPALAQNC